MKHETFDLRSRDGLKLKGRHWAAKDTKGSILLVHGIGEHIGRYAHVADFFSGRGFDFFAYDLRGHGDSQGKPGHSPSYDLLLDDLDKAIEFVKAKSAERPIFLYGHSFGGNIVASYILAGKRPVKGAILASAWLKLSDEPGATAQQMARAMSRIYPSYTQALDIDINYLSSDREVIAAYKADPKVHNVISMKLFVDAYDAGLEALKGAKNLKLPLLVMHGDEDMVTSPEGSKAFALRSGKHSELKLWANDRHELHNEPDQVAVLKYALHWLERHL